MVTERIHGETYKHKVADIEGYVDPTAVITAHKAEADAHTAANITNVPAGDIAAVTVQAALNELDSEKVSKSGSITQITTRNHNDLQNLNAGSAHPSASIDNTSTSYGRGLATTDNTVQKIADRVNQNGTPAFKTSKDKCPLMLNFKDGLADSTNGITPIGYNTATKNKTDNFISNPDGSISATLKQFEGDEGLFGAGVAVEESRTNLFTYSDDLTNAAWTKTNCTVTLDRILPDGRKLFKITAIASGDAYITIPCPTSLNSIYSSSMYIMNTDTNISFSFISNLAITFFQDAIKHSKLTRIFGTATSNATQTHCAVGINAITAGATAYITSPQLEVGSFPTSYIATGATAVTRPAGKLPFDAKLINPKLGSISLWYKPNYNFDIATAASEELFEFDTGTYNDILYAEYNNASDCFSFRSTSAANSNVIVTSAYTAETFNGKTFHIVCEWDNTNIHLYVNGILIGSALNYNINNVFTRFAIGCLANTVGYEAQGTISNFEIFNYALTADEIANIYNAGLENKPVELDNGKTVSEADRLSPNIEAGSNKAQFVTDKTKCSLLLDFKGTLADRSRAINPIGSDAINKWVDNYVNDSTTKTSATNISCTLKQFDGDEGLFGSGVAVEESRTNLLLYSDDLTNAAYWSPYNCTVTFDRTLSDGRKLFKLTCTGIGGMYLQTLNMTFSNITYSAQLGIIKNNTKLISMVETGSTSFLSTTGQYNNLTTVKGTGTGTAATTTFLIYSNDAIPGDTFYITSPQLEAGAFPTSYIATGATAVTRPAGNLRYSNSIIPNNYGSISLQFKANFKDDTLVNKTIFSSHSVDNYNYFGLRFDITLNKFLLTLNTDELPSLSTYISSGILNSNHHFVITWSGTSAKWYIDNILQGEAVISSNFIQNITAFILGALTNLSFTPFTEYQANGTISNFVIFNYALSDAEISQIYNSGLEGKPVVCTNPESIIGIGQTLHDPNFITFTSGWGISSTYPNKPTLSKSSNVALMRGILEYSGTVNSDVTIFTLPTGHRPSLPDTYYHSFVATARDSGSPAMRILRVYGNGDVKLMAQGATIVNPAISLDNINFVNGK